MLVNGLLWLAACLILRLYGVLEEKHYDQGRPPFCIRGIVGGSTEMQ